MSQRRLTSFNKIYKVIELDNIDDIHIRKLENARMDMCKCEDSGA